MGPQTQLEYLLVCRIFSLIRRKKIDRDLHIIHKIYTACLELCQEKDALEKVQGKELTLRAAAATYGIPRSTFSEHVNRVRRKRYGGDSTILTHCEEREIVLTCQILVEMGFPLTKDYVEVIARDYL